MTSDLAISQESTIMTKSELMTKTGSKSTLQVLDEQKTSLFHFKSVIVAGSGFFTDAYDLFSIGLLTKLLGRLYYQSYDVTGSFATGKASLKVGGLPINVNAAVNGVALCGTLAGQLFFGACGDKFGRKAMYGLSQIIMILAAVGQACTFGPNTPKAVMGTLCFFRFWLGFGVGGDYPLSSVIMSEYSSTSNRGAFVGAVFAQQGTGILAAATITIIVSSIFRRGVGAEHDMHFAQALSKLNAEFKAGTFPLHNGAPDAHYVKDYLQMHTTPASADYVWRIVLLLSVLPACFTLYYRLVMPETARFTALVRKDTKKALADMERITGIKGQMKEDVVDEQKSEMTFREFLRKFGLPLIGAAGAWFMLDVSYYSQNLLQSSVLSGVGFIPSNTAMSALGETYKGARAQAIIALSSTIPGYWVTVFTVDKIGRKPIQLMGFIMMTAFMAGLSGGYQQLKSTPHASGFVVLYCLTFFFSNFGPNATTFIVPSELFPARWRATGHGFCAACGKAGAIVGSFGFLYASQKSHGAAPYPDGIGANRALAILAATSGAGTLFTFLIPETKGKSLEELSGEKVDDETPESSESGYANKA